MQRVRASRAAAQAAGVLGLACHLPRTRRCCSCGWHTAAAGRTAWSRPQPAGAAGTLDAAWQRCPNAQAASTAAVAHLGVQVAAADDDDVLQAARDVQQAILDVRKVPAVR
jgi:deferrochelatase/peroxidase EfeB